MIGYYVHHHGAGHAQRFMAVRAYLPELVGLGSGPRPDGLPASAWIPLPLDTSEPQAVDPTAGGALHWAPLGEPGLRARTAALAQWAQVHGPSALVVDVSVEIALAARLLSIPTVVVAQHGDRSDDAHTLAYRSASAIAALWNEASHPDPPAAADRTHHIGPISRFDGRPPHPPPAAARPTRRALLMLGRGGHGITADHIAQAVDSTKGTWDWVVVGHDDAPAAWRSADEVWDALGSADVVIAPASNNCIAEVAAARRPLVVLPQPRPFGEQHAHAALIERQGLAIIEPEWPARERWPGLLERASEQDASRWEHHHDRRGAQRMAELVLQVAA